MKCTILGCGRYQITSNYNSTGNLITTHQIKLVLDFGRGNLHALTQLGYTVNDIDVICISHTHPDHVADLLAFFQAHFIDYKRGLTTRQLHIIGPSGIRRWFSTIASLVQEDLGYQPVLYEAPTRPIIIGDVSITTASVQHNVPALGYRISCDQKTVMYSGDTGYTDQLFKLAHNADVAILECSNAPDQTSEFHLNPQACGEIASSANVRQLVLTHYGGTERIPELQRETGKYFSGILTVAEELLSFNL
ncbi:MAG: MBL fold metallo-hydrolase [Candidatus Kerfeldbacteria bacterium]|nr:MBL fold metallo-hydrolase [Candidatus Kerfeldbacteria bacterium]